MLVRQCVTLPSPKTLYIVCVLQYVVYGAQEGIASAAEHAALRLVNDLTGQLDSLKHEKRGLQLVNTALRDELRMGVRCLFVFVFVLLLLLLLFHLSTYFCC